MWQCIALEHVPGVNPSAMWASTGDRKKLTLNLILGTFPLVHISTAMYFLTTGSGPHTQNTQFLKVLKRWGDG